MTLFHSKHGSPAIYDLKSRRQFPIIEVMQWLIGSTVLLAVALLLRRVLHMGATATAPVSGLVPLRPDLQAIYQPLAQEVEANTTILGITLNDAFGEREARRHEMAWRVVRLAVGEWARLAELVVGVQTVLTKYLPTTTGIVPLRRIAAGHFKSREVIDHVGFYEFLDQVLFSSKRRFSLQLRVLSQSSVLLSKQFRRACREGERTLDASEELWSRLDYYFHDFDLIAKETLLALQTLLVCQSPEGAQELALDLQGLLERGVRVSVSPSGQ
jgi:hypothetical protein